METRDSPPRTFALDRRLLADAKARILAGDGALDAPLSKLKQEATQSLSQGPWSVVNKSAIPPSDDKHDYLSLARYFWPDPTKPDGLPYISRDGEVNPEIFTIPDHRNFDMLMENALTLSLAFYFTREERFSEHAARALRVWFLDEATRMNPNLNFCQGIRGVNDGRHAGIIESRDLSCVVDAIGLLVESKAWTDRDQRGMERWFTRFLDWLVYNDMARHEAKQENNHGTFYDAQVISLALFLGETDLARHFALKSSRRIAVQVEPDGRQPLELGRTIAWHYSVFNLQALYRLAMLAEHVGVDLWNYTTDDGRSLRKATEFLLPYVQGKQWDYAQIAPQDFTVIFDLLCLASAKYRDASFIQVALHSPGIVWEIRRARLLLNLGNIGDAMPKVAAI